jgi:hypothetical protein
VATDWYIGGDEISGWVTRAEPPILAGIYKIVDESATTKITIKCEGRVAIVRSRSGHLEVERSN